MVEMRGKTLSTEFSFLLAPVVMKSGELTLTLHPSPPYYLVYIVHSVNFLASSELSR